MAVIRSVASPVRILAIAPTSFFADYGCHVRIRGQIAALRKRGYQVRLVTYPSGRDVDGIDIRRAAWPARAAIQVGSSRLKLALDAVLTPTVLAAAFRFRPHIIHAYLHEGALIGTLLKRLFHWPLVFDYQGSLTSEMLDHRFIKARSPWLPFLRRLEGWIDRQPDAILASSTHAATPLVSQFGVSPQRVATLHDSVDPAHFRPAHMFDPAQLAALRDQLRVPREGRLLVYLGLLAPYQGTDLLLEALVILIRTRPDVHLLLMGFPFVETYRARAEQMGIASHVTFTGAVPYEQAPMYLALGQIAVAPKLSATEGSGKLLPYMAAALPIAAFDTPVHREYLGELGVYAPPGDARRLAAAVNDLLAAPSEAARRGLALRDVVSRRYTWEQAAIQIEEAYKTLLGRDPVCYNQNLQLTEVPSPGRCRDDGGEG